MNAPRASGVSVYFHQAAVDSFIWYKNDPMGRRLRFTFLIVDSMQVFVRRMTGMTRQSDVLTNVDRRPVLSCSAIQPFAMSSVCFSCSAVATFPGADYRADGFRWRPKRRTSKAAGNRK